MFNRTNEQEEKSKANRIRKRDEEIANVGAILEVSEICVFLPTWLCQ